MEQSEPASPLPEPSRKQKRKDNRQIITPYAFEVPARLYGTPLASPLRRAGAISIDLLIVAILSGVSGNALSILIAIVLIIAARNMRKRGRSSLRVNSIRLVAVLVFVLALLDLGWNTPSTSSNNITSGVLKDNGDIVTSTDALVTMVFTGKYLLQISSFEQQVKDGDCEDFMDCWKELSEDLVKDLLELEVSLDSGLEMINEFYALAEDSLTTEQIESLKVSTIDSFSKRYQAQLESHKDEDEKTVETPATSENQYSILKWAQGIAADFGLGFGWAALYFSALTGLFHGQTLGKMVFGIRVIKLDGSYLTLWESFGRYGGYGAGLATGLSGFLQVYWDANRQAIQDKISETLVINLRKPQQPYTPASKE